MAKKSNLMLKKNSTKMFLLGLRPFEKAEEELGQVADDDEGWRQSWAAVVFHNQVVSLKLPEDVCVALNYLKCVAAKTNIDYVVYNDTTNLP